MCEHLRHCDYFGGDPAYDAADLQEDAERLALPTIREGIAALIQGRDEILCCYPGADNSEFNHHISELEKLFGKVDK